MIIIGEKINGTIPRVKEAIEKKNSELIRDLAVRQAEAGADYIDICAGTVPGIEVETMIWLMNIVQDAVDKPLCIDSPNPETIKAVFTEARKPGIINSVSGEGNKCDIIYPLIKGSDWQVIALTCNDSGIPSEVTARVEITRNLVEKAKQYDISPERIHIDPLVIALSTDNSSLAKFLKTMKTIKEIYPEIKVTSGLSNISFGLPLRKTINQAFLAIALYEGLDSAIMDPSDEKMLATLFATRALIGQDTFCRNYTTAFRQGRITARVK